MSTNNMRNKNGEIIDIGVLVMGFFAGFIIALVMSSFLFSSNEPTLIKLIQLDLEVTEISDKAIEAEFYYTEAGYDYENRNYNSLQTNCRLSRERSSTYVQGLRDIKATITEEEPIFLTYKDILSEGVIIYNNLFEACEYFESAARYYKTYYQPGTPYDDMSYDMGTGEIEMMNEKIKKHDDAVNRYNDLLAEYKVELEGMVE